MCKWFSFLVTSVVSIVILFLQSFSSHLNVTDMVIHVICRLNTGTNFFVISGDGAISIHKIRGPCLMIHFLCDIVHACHLALIGQQKWPQRTFYI